MASPPSTSEEQLEPPIASPPPISFIPPSIDPPLLHSGTSYTHFSPVPPSLFASTESLAPTPCILGIDEAGRGPVLGPMVYGCFYLPGPLSTPLLQTTHHFDDSKVLKPAFRTQLMRSLCDPTTSLHTSCGWAVSVLSAQAISAGMLKPGATYNLNAQAMNATVALIEGVYARGVDVKEIYVDTVGPPVSYQKLLANRFPRAVVRVEKKADSLFAVVSAASVVAKVTRDVGLEVLFEGLGEGDGNEDGWGSGYPSDARCTGWMRRNLHPVFGWGNECRFSWGPAKDLLEDKGSAVAVDWPVDEEEGDSHRVTDFFRREREDGEVDELGGWFGRPVGMEVF